MSDPASDFPTPTQAGLAVIADLVAAACKAARAPIADPVSDEPPLDTVSDSAPDNVVPFSGGSPREGGATKSRKKTSGGKSKGPKFTADKPPSGPLVARAKLDTTDLGIAKRLVDYTKGKVRFCPGFKGSEGGGWLVFGESEPAHGVLPGAEGGGGHKFHVATGHAKAVQAVSVTVRDKMLFEEYPALSFLTPPKDVADADDDKKVERAGLLAQAKSVHRAGKGLGNTKSVRSALEMARTLPKIRTEFRDWDADSHAINTPGGLLSLPTIAPPLPSGPGVEPEEVDHARRMAAWSVLSAPNLRPAKPADLVTRITNGQLIDLPRPGEDGATPDPHPHFTKTLQDALPSKAVREFFQRVAGSCLVSDNPENSWFVLHGKGQDGKSTLMRAIREALGQYAKSGDIKTFLYDARRSSSGPREDLMALVGAVRLVLVSEPEVGAALSDEILKQVTGGDEVSARGGHQTQREYVAQFKLVMMCNELPKVRGEDDGVWRRPLVITFPNSIPSDQADRRLKYKLAKETDAIMLWLLAGYLDWWSRGFEYDPPDSVRRDTEKWRKSSSDLIAWAEARIVWGEWIDPDVLAGAAADIRRMIEHRDASAITDDMLARVAALRDNQGRQPRYSPEDIYEDFEQWSHEEGKDPWKKRGFQMAFARLAEKRGAERRKSDGRRLWSGFDFTAGFARTRITDSSEWGRS